MSISVVIPAYNASATIARAIQTVQKQTRQVDEIIVVDDASADDTSAVVEREAKADPRVQLIRNPVNKGPSGSRNAGFRAAKGDWLVIHDADDAWVETRIEKMMDAAAKYDVDIVTDNMLLHDIGSDEIIRSGFPESRGLRWIKPIDVFEQDVQLGAEFGYGLLQPAIRAQFLKDHGLAYNEAIRYGEDLIFLIEMMFSGARAIILPDPLYIYTTRIGVKTGAVSPFSQSSPKFDLIADNMEALRPKYAAQITPEISRAMTKLVTRYRVVHDGNIAKQKRQEKGLFAYALHVASHPAVAAHILRHQYWKRVSG